ncbi:MAG: zf-HC2 domain-containing protein [Deltaproteobacteria bacterium]|nr:zf-HC2 domain-containing protein [Deltaproteobacteria bacterium]
MDCRETKPLLTAFHDVELPDADRVRVEEHLRGCPGCRALLADLARADEAAGVPDPGPGYWDRFNKRVADRIEREAEGKGVTVLRPKRGWMRQQFRFLVPAVAAAALVVVVVHYGGLTPVAPTPTVPKAVSEPARLDSAGQRVAKAVPEPPAKKKKESAAAVRPAPAESSRAAEAPAYPSSAIADGRFATGASEERDHLANRLQSEGKGMTYRDQVAAPAGIGSPSPPPPVTIRSAPAGSPPVSVADGIQARVQVEQENMAEAAAPAAMPVGKARAKAGPSPPASDLADTISPCETARKLADEGRLREAETAQRACLAQDPSAPSQEKGLIFLAELLDRQARFAEADSVITEVDRQFPQSRPLDLYRQQRPMVQKQLAPVPVTR